MLIDGNRRTQFVKGQNLLALIISFHLLFGLATIASFQTIILPAFLDLAYHVDGLDPATKAELHTRATTFQAQVNPLSQQMMGFAFHIFWCIMLYLGYSWVRILWGLSWLMAGVGTLFFIPTLFLFPSAMLLLSVMIVCGLIYGVGGAMLLFSPAIRTYSYMMRH